ncbi:hypothetical protein WJX73_007081 [Symbiochloris irregularis]|uniref:Uncharacterized protein n=1 Tax=Symbiochloris irregularis TaxID=706552 RepID=A0AAW1P612_9CHLO
MWYRREFTIPPAWASQRIYLHFGAVDWESTVYLNGRELGVHKGGYSTFSYDITEVLRTSSHGVQEVVVGVFDPTELADGVPVGKQRERIPGDQSILYHATSGIWRTVWLEPVPDQHIRRVDMIPDVDKKLLSATVHGSADAEGLECGFRVADAGKEVALVPGRVGKTFTVPIPEPKLWFPDSPHLYDVDVWIVNKKAAEASSAKDPAGAADHVKSYTAMRKTALGKDRNGSLRLMLNDVFIFQVCGMLISTA